MAPNNISEEVRQARRERWLAMHNEIVVDPQTGLERRRVGGPQPRSGRPRKVRASELIAEKVSAEADAYFEKMDDIAKNGKNSEALMAIRDLLGIEEKERQITHEKEQDLAKLQRDDLILLALGLIKKTGVISTGFDIEGQVEEIEDGGYPELSS